MADINFNKPSNGVQQGLPPDNMLPQGVNISRSSGSSPRPISLTSSVASYSTRAFTPPRIQTHSIVEDITPKESRALHALYTSIHKYDPIVGQATDLLANMPFGEFSISGCDPEVLKIYQDCLDELKLQDYLHEYCRDFLVYGKVCLHFIFNKSKGIWTDIIQHDVDSIEIIPIPIVGMNPLVRLIPNDVMKNFGNMLITNPNLSHLRQKFDQSFIESMLRGQTLELPESNTAYIPRKLNGHDYQGTSLYSRILGLVFYEYAIFNGNIDVLNRRIAPIRIISVPKGEQDGTIPTAEELASVGDMLIQADRDPGGAYVSVKRAIQLDSIPVGEHIQLSQEADFIRSNKMLALGISESLLTGDTSVSTAETALSLFIERIKNLRTFFEQKIFYEKIFEPLARVHKFYKRTEAELAHKVYSNGPKNWTNYGSDLTASYRNSSDLVLPIVTWMNSLKPNNDSSYIDLLGQAEEKGLPISADMWASAFGYKIDDVLSGLNKDIDDWKKLSDYKKQVEAIKGTSGGEGGGDDDDGGGSSFTFSLKSSPSTLENYAKNLSSHKFYKNGKFIDSSPDNIAKVYDSLKSKGLLNDKESIESVCSRENVKPSTFKYALSELNVVNYPLSKNDALELTSSIMESTPQEGKDFWELTNQLNSKVKKTSTPINKRPQPKTNKKLVNEIMGNLQKMQGNLYTGI